MLLMSLDSGSCNPLSDCSCAGHLSPGRRFPSSEGSCTSYFTLLLLTFRLAFEGRGEAAARPASFTIICLIQLEMEPFLSSRPGPVRAYGPEVLCFSRTAAALDEDKESCLWEEDPVMSVGEREHGPGLWWGGSQGSGCHLHLQDPSVAQRQLIKFTLGVSEGPVDAVKAPTSVRQQKESQLSALHHGGAVGGALHSGSLQPHIPGFPPFSGDGNGGQRHQRDTGRVHLSVPWRTDLDPGQSLRWLPLRWH